MNKEELKKEMENYKPEMTSNQRLKAYFDGQRVDHLPLIL